MLLQADMTALLKGSSSSSSSGSSSQFKSNKPLSWTPILAAKATRMSEPPDLSRAVVADPVSTTTGPSGDPFECTEQDTELSVCWRELLL